MKNPMLRPETCLSQIALLATAFSFATTSFLCAAPPEIKAVGNHLENKAVAGAVVRLTGVNLPSLQWGPGENLVPSLTQILGTWKANAIRLNISQASWLAGGTYLTTVDTMVNQVSAAGGYIIIDNHGYIQPDNNAITFWTSVATRYKNNPAVLFGLLNEPHDTTWDVWRNGDANGPGLQAVLNAVRGTGANNLVVVGGLKWASDLSGVLPGGGYALTDTSSGNGIMYDMHIYPWHAFAGWVVAARTYPILIGECGHDGSTTGGTGTSFGGNSPLLYWTLLNKADAMGVNFTAWAFHMSGGPALITENGANYTPVSCAGQFVYNHLLSLRDSAHESTVLNQGFETPVTATFAYRPAGATWTFTGNAGIQKTWAAALAPGTQTAFLQTATASDSGQNGIDGAMTQTFNFDATGTYAVSFLLSQRVGKAELPIRVSVDGVPVSSVCYTPSDSTGADLFSPVTTAPFTINSVGNHTIKLEAVASPGVNKEALIDNVSVAAMAPAWMKNQGFGAPNLTNGTFTYRPTNGIWTFAGNSGIELNALGATPAPEGRYLNAGFLQTAAATDTGNNAIDGTITQTIEFAAPGAYSLAFKAASRSGKGNLGIQVIIDGVVTGTVTPTSTAWASFVSPAFNIRIPGYHTVQLAATPNATVDNEAFIDDLSVTVPVASFTKYAPLAIGEAGFESSSPSAGHGKQPTGTAWTYTGSLADPYYAGIQDDYSNFHNYDIHPAPEGWQTAFFSSNNTLAGAISQTINFPSSGTYAVNFQAQMGRNGGVPLTVSIDGTTVGTYTPPSKAYYPFTTPTFTVSGGNHTLKIACPLTAAGPFTMVDAVNIWQDPSMTLTGQDIGAVGLAGNDSSTGAAYTVNASGADIWYGTDAFRFVSMPMTGDGTFTARVNSLTYTNAWAKAGVMMRNGLGASDANVATLVTPNTSTYLQVRTVAGGGSANVAGPVVGVATPYWVKIKRVGSLFTSSVSPDGVTWTVISSQTVTMNSNIYVGLAACSHNNAALTTAQFDNVSFAP